MRRALKFLHTLASCGLIGSLLGYLLVLAVAPQETARAYAETRQVLAALANYLLLPSLALALVSGLLAMAVHKPFLDLRWVWAKAVLGLSLFEATLAVVQAKASSAAEAAARLAGGEGDAALLAEIIANERPTLFAILALSVAQIVLGIWRPGLGAARANRGRVAARPVPIAED